MKVHLTYYLQDVADMQRRHQILMRTPSDVRVSFRSVDELKELDVD